VNVDPLTATSHKKMKLSLAVLLALGALMAPAMALRDPIVIDGSDTTIALAVAKITPEDIIKELLELATAIVHALNQPKFDYWGNVEDDVKLVVGSYINNHSIHQVELFSKDLQTLLLRYAEAPAHSSDYADKDHQAAALNMAILSHRFLVMSGDLKFSLILHFQDIAAMHLSVLQDAAETYSTNTSTSQWYVDLNEALGGYITYLTNTTEQLDTFRTGAIKCVIKKGDCTTVQNDEGVVQWTTCYDVYSIYDYVTGHKDVCKQLAGRTDCVDTCADYKAHIQQQMGEFLAAKVTPVQQSWEHLYNMTKPLVPKASRFYNPATQSKHVF